MSKRKIGIVTAVLVLLIAGSVWAVHKIRADAQVARVKKMQDEMFAGGRPKPGDFDRLQKEMANLSPDQQRQVRDHGRRNFQREMAKRVDEYFAAPPAKRKEILDKHIQEMEKMRKEMEKRRAEGGGPSGPPGGGPNQVGASGGQTAGQGGPPGGPGTGSGGGDGSNRTAQGQSERRNSMLDNTSPAQRANMAAYFSALQQRRMELGLPAFPGFMGGGPRGR